WRRPRLHNKTTPRKTGSRGPRGPNRDPGDWPPLRAAPSSALLLLAGAAMAQVQADSADVLDRARVRLQAMTRVLEKYVCVETVNRNYYRRATPGSVPAPAPVCPATATASGRNVSAGEEGRILEFTDRVRLEVAVSQTRELHSWPGATGFDLRDVDELIRDG